MALQTITSKDAQEMIRDSHTFRPLAGVVRYKQDQSLELKRQHLRWEQVEGSPMGKVRRVLGLERAASLAPTVTLTFVVAG